MNKFKNLEYNELAKSTPKPREKIPVPIHFKDSWHFDPGEELSAVSDVEAKIMKSNKAILMASIIVEN